MRDSLDAVDPLSNWPAALRRALPRPVLGGILVSQRLNIVVPARLGDVARVYQVAASKGLSKTRVAATRVVEEVAGLLIFALGVVFLLLVVAPDWVRASSTSLLIAGLLGVIATVVFCRRGRPLLAWLDRHTPARSQPRPGPSEAV